ncbi:MAG TPA: hypothetical protein VFP40_15460 [Terriglobales bacterium]|nr:hypothetical protein [Terriglobales bacterium]
MTVEKSRALRGWQQIATFLGQPLSVAQRWAKSGMPVRRQGRYVIADTDQLSAWLGREQHLAAPAHIAASEGDLIADLKQSLKTSKHKK